ncbi:MAG: glycosyltransferase family 2 protein [Candidatus Aenigmatarchaeota archaeon]
MRKKYPMVCIIILNWNGKKLLKKCLDSLINLTDYPNYRIIFVDNGSTDGSVDFIKNNYENIDIVALDRNYGFTGGNNIGIKYAEKKYKPDYFLLLNNDTEIIQKDWLKKLVESAKKYKAGIVGCKLLYPNRKIQHAGINTTFLSEHIGRYENEDKYSEIRYVNAVTFACVLINRNVFEKIGLLDEIFFSGHEDIDFCFRARKNGIKILYNGKVKIIHYESVSYKNIFNEKRWYMERFGGFVNTLRHKNFLFFIFIVWFYIFESFFERKNPKISLSSFFIRPRKKFVKMSKLTIKALKFSILSYKKIKIKRLNKS